jgi:hypothetical protein
VQSRASRSVRAIRVARRGSAGPIAASTRNRTRCDVRQGARTTCGNQAFRDGHGCGRAPTPSSDMGGTTMNDTPTSSPISGDHHNQIRSCLALTNTSGRIHFGAIAIELSGVRSVRFASSHVRILCGLHPSLQNDFRYGQHTGPVVPSPSGLYPR